LQAQACLNRAGVTTEIVAYQLRDGSIVKAARTNLPSTSKPTTRPSLTTTLAGRGSLRHE
jgi:hypothetical protein